MELAAEKRDGGDGAEGDNRNGDIGDSWLVDLRSEKESQNQDNPPVNCENHESVAGNVSQNAFGDADGCDVWNFACKQECGYETDNACDGTCNKLRETLAQVVVHDAEIRTRRFQECVCDKACDSDGGNDGRISCGVGCACGNGSVNLLDWFLAKIPASEEE